MNQPLRKANVIDFSRYRARQRPPDLPLFARPLRREPAVITPFRRLTPREVAHRTRMLAHLRAVEG